MRELPGEQDTAENEGARVQASRRGGPPDEGRYRAHQASDPSVCHCHTFHRSIETILI